MSYTQYLPSLMHSSINNVSDDTSIDIKQGILCNESALTPSAQLSETSRLTNSSSLFKPPGNKVERSAFNAFDVKSEEHMSSSLASDVSISSMSPNAANFEFDAPVSPKAYLFNTTEPSLKREQYDNYCHYLKRQCTNVNSSITSDSDMGLNFIGTSRNDNEFDKNWKDIESLPFIANQGLIIGSNESTADLSGFEVAPGRSNKLTSSHTNTPASGEGNFFPIDSLWELSPQYTQSECNQQEYTNSKSTLKESEEKICSNEAPSETVDYENANREEGLRKGSESELESLDLVENQSKGNGLGVFYTAPLGNSNGNINSSFGEASSYTTCRKPIIPQNDSLHLNFYSQPSDLERHLPHYNRLSMVADFHKPRYFQEFGNQDKSSNQKLFAKCAPTQNYTSFHTNTQQNIDIMEVMGFGDHHLANRNRSISKMPLSRMYELMGLANDHIKAKWREERIMDIVRAEGFDVGNQTWIRDTEEPTRKRIIDSIYHQTSEFGYTHEIIEVIVRRGTYARMQSKLRQKRRLSRKYGYSRQIAC